MIVTLEKLSPGELHNLTRLAPETDEGRRFKERVLIAWFERTHPWALSVRGRDQLLSWFVKQERIMSRDELGAALRRIRAERAA
jgi:hypothetical protein